MLQLEDSDNDICDEEELDTLFEKKYRLLLEHKVAFKDSFILHLAGTNESNFNLAVGATFDICEVYNFSNNQIAKIDTLGEHVGGIVGVRFSPDNNNLLYTASIEGYIHLWDLRTPCKSVKHFQDTTIDKSQNSKPLQCFDVSPNNRLIAGGTELSGGEAFILFWDIRNVKLLGGYWESHTDDITQVQFHPDEVDLLASASTDGLINIYDVSQTHEDDALLNSFNTESSIEQLLWCRYKTKDCISTITHTADIQLWRRDGVEPMTYFRREDLGPALKRKSSDHCYIVSAHAYDPEKIFLLAASNWNDGECLRALQVNNTNLEPLFMLKENKQRTRCSWFNQHHKVLVTGGESGLLNFWNIDINR